MYVNWTYDNDPKRTEAPALMVPRLANRYCCCEPVVTMERKGQGREEEQRASCRLMRPAVGPKRRAKPNLECISTDIHVHQDADQITRRCS
jgi:hypothetical protein